LAGWQDRGKYDCEKIEVQFGDGYITILPVFSGIYTFEKGPSQKDDDKRLNRPVYWDKQRGAAFRYCRKDDSGALSFANSGYWVFNILLDDVKTVGDMCENFISRSPDTKGFDLLEHPGRSWLTKRRLNDTVQYEVDFFQLRCADCKDETCNGKCVNGECKCNSNQYGFNCQFTDPPCPKTDYDRRTKPFSGVGDDYSSKYTLMRNRDNSTFYSYNRPVYYFTWDDGMMDILLNFGRRYFLFDFLATKVKGAVSGYKTVEGKDPIPIINTSVIVDHLTGFHPWYDWVKPIYSTGKFNSTQQNKDIFPSIYKVPVFVSDPIDVGTQTDSLSPLGLGWKRINQQVISKRNYFDMFSIGASVDTVLLCSRCSDGSPCRNGGTCQRNETCACKTLEQFDDDWDDDSYEEGQILYSGTLCELDCTEEGSDENAACKSDFDPWADDDYFNDYYDDYYDDDGNGDDDNDGDDGTGDTDDGDAGGNPDDLQADGDPNNRGDGDANAGDEPNEGGDGDANAGDEPNEGGDVDPNADDDPNVNGDDDPNAGVNPNDDGGGDPNAGDDDGGNGNGVGGDDDGNGGGGDDDGNGGGGDDDGNGGGGDDDGNGGGGDDDGNGGGDDDDDGNDV